MSKPGRQKVILEIVENGEIASQEELAHALARRGFKVGQATLSRDIHELGLVKAREFVLDVRQAQNLIVVKTAVGSAQPVAAALDEEQWPEVVGTIAGDDAILIVTPDTKAARKLEQKIRGLLAR
jgi:transcriptional regulator of arginine metabolism